MKRVNREVVWPLVTWSRDLGGIRTNYALRLCRGAWSKPKIQRIGHFRPWDPGRWKKSVRRDVARLVDLTGYKGPNCPVFCLIDI
jgi:hypothetical protein